MAADSERILRWRDGRLTTAESATGPLVVADSFLLSDGGAIALDRHRDRFLSSIGDPAIAQFAGGPLPRDADRFWAAALAELPSHDAWFPRLELAATEDGPELRLRLRPAPPVATTVPLTTWTGPDPRRVPRIKGPDLEALLAVRAAVLPRGAGEAVLVSPEGLVCDGSTSAIAWWEEGALCVPPAASPRVDSVTAGILLELAASAGIRVQRVPRSPGRLASCEVWALNALHGVRRVDAWVDGPSVGAEEGRLAEWRSRLDALRRPIGPAAAAD